MKPRRSATHQARRPGARLVRTAKARCVDTPEGIIGTLDEDMFIGTESGSGSGSGSGSEENPGVTVSIWSDDWTYDTGFDVVGVLPPPWAMPGIIPAGSWVRVKIRRDGRPYADAAPC